MLRAVVRIGRPASPVLIVSGILALGCGHAAAVEPQVVLPPGSVEEFPIVGESSLSTGLAVDDEGSLWFDEMAPGRLDRITQAGVINGEFDLPMGPWFEEGFPPQWPESSMPRGLALGAHDNVWFADSGTAGEGQTFVGVVGPAGEGEDFPIPPPSVPGPRPGAEPTGIALGADGNMWVTEGAQGTIARVTQDGEVTVFTTLPNDRDDFMQPRAIALGADGNMWFTELGVNDLGQNSIGRITPGGSITEFSLPPGYERPDALALGADGDIWFTESPSAIGRITPTGAFSEFTVPSVSGALDGIALGPDGNMWFTESSNAIGRITPAGVVTSFEGATPAGEVPGALAPGAEGVMWYVSGSRVDRLHVPFAPLEIVAPAVSGQALEGETLSASEGLWSHAPSYYTYQWQICDASGGDCLNLSGQNQATHLLTASEVGYTLRAVVTASNIAGEASATSSVSATVLAVPQSTPVPTIMQKPPVVEPLPVISSAMTWSFGWTRRYTTVRSLVVRGIPAGGVVEVTCRGRGCAFEHWRSDAHNRQPTSCKRRRCTVRSPRIVDGMANLSSLFESSHIGVHARMVVNIIKPGWIAKSFVFTIRADRPPRVQITCLGAGPSNPQGGC
jgi:virginiamycin B lyase